MAGLTDAQSMSYANEVLEIVSQSRSAFEGKPVDAPTLIENLRREIKEAQEAEAAQARQAAATVQATELAYAQRREAYAAAQGLVGIIEGVLGKDHALIRRLRNIRDSYVQEALRGRSRSQAGPAQT